MTLLQANGIRIESRIGLLDRKLRVVNENADNKSEWIDYSIKAMKSVYGYEFQGDNLFIARFNLLCTYIEYYNQKFKEYPTEELLEKVAKIISWNVWQMDGLKMVVPYSCKNSFGEQLDLFGKKHVDGKRCIGCEKNTIVNHNGTKCYVMDWKKNKKVKFESLMR